MKKFSPPFSCYRPIDCQINRHTLFWRLSLISLLLVSVGSRSEKPELLLANSYSPTIELSDYWVSEKLDGFRGYYDGHRLISRSGHTIGSPDWFTQCFPKEPLDGEIWLDRGQFQSLASIVKTGAKHPDWDKVSFQVFDLPAQRGNFDQRLGKLRQLFHALNDCPQIQLIDQYKIATHADLDRELSRLEKLGAEGLMLHKGSSDYQAGRNGDLLKLKRAQDAEATVIGHTSGKGKYQGLVGALVVKDDKDRVFRIGSGLSDQQRRQPPDIGVRITYRYSGLTDKGIPRFARFLRVRQDL